MTYVFSLKYIYVLKSGVFVDAGRMNTGSCSWMESSTDWGSDPGHCYWSISCGWI